MNREELKTKIKIYLKETASTALKQSIIRVVESKIKRFIIDHDLKNRFHGNIEDIKNFLFSSAAVSVSGGNPPPYYQLSYADCPDVFKEIAFPQIPGGLPIEVAGEAGSEFIQELVEESASSFNTDAAIETIVTSIDILINPDPDPDFTDDPDPDLDPDPDFTDDPDSSIWELISEFFVPMN